MTKYLPWLIGLLVLAGVLAACIQAGMPVAPANVDLRLVTRVIDGDGIEVAGSQRDIRLQGIDAREYKEPCWAEAKVHLARLVEGRRVRVEILDYDSRWDRDVAFIWLEGELINLAVVQAGWAKIHPNYPPKAYRDQFEVAQSEAIRMRRGMWGQCR